MRTDKKYYAFISYKREDEAWAKWLQNKLEHYKLPSNLNGTSDLPKEIRPIFRDQSDLAGGVLAEEINKALENSQYLIVICSQRAARSEWVGKEVQTFIEMGRTDKIIPFIVGGEPHSENLEEECLPLSLKALPKEQELLGVNINEMGRDAAAVKVIAWMFGLRFDELWQRHEREAKKRRTWIVIASVMAFLTMAGIAFWMFMQRQQTLKANWKMLENQSKLVANEVMKNAKDDSYLARMVALDILPQNVNNPTDRPYTAEAERALRKACDYNTAILRGESGGISFVKFSPDGKRILSLFPGYAAKLWDVESGAEILTVKDDVVLGETNFSPDGKRIITATEGAFTVWNAETGEKLWTLENGIYNYTIKFTSDGKNIISINDTTIQIIDVITYDLLSVSIENKGESFVFDISSDNKYLACVSSKELLDYYDYDMQELPYDDNDTIYDENTIRIFEIASGEEILSFKGHKRLIISIEISPDGGRIVTTSTDRDIIIWDAVTGTKLQNMNWDKNSMAYKAVFSPDGTKVFTSHMSGLVKAWDALTGNEIKRWKAHGTEAYSVAISPNGKKLATSSHDGTIIIFDIDSNESNVVERIIPDEINADNKAWLVKRDGKVFAYNKYGNADWNIYGNLLNDKYFKVIMPDKERVIINAETGKEMMSVDYYNHEECYFAPNNQIVYIRHDLDSFVNTIRFLNIETGEETHRISSEYYGWINSADVSLTGKSLVITQSYSVIVLDFETGNKIMELKGHVAQVKSAKFSPDGKLIVSTDINGITNVWDAETGELKQNFSENKSDFSFSSDGRYILSKPGFNKYNVIDLETGSCVYSIEGSGDNLAYAIFVNNDKQIMTISTDGTVRIWDFPPLQELIDQTRERFKDRQLTEEERKMYYLE